MSSIYCLLDYPIISWAQISDQMRTASYFFRKTFPPNIWINSKFSNFLQIFLISAASSLLTGEESKCATHSYHLLQICHFLYFFGNFFTFQKRNVFTHNVFHSCIFPCEESFFKFHTKSYWQKLFFIFCGEESICATHSSAATGLFLKWYFLYFYKDMPCFSHFCEQIFSYSFKMCFTFLWWRIEGCNPLLGCQPPESNSPKKLFSEEKNNSHKKKQFSAHLLQISI